MFDTPEEANKFADEKAANDLSIKGYKLITVMVLKNSRLISTKII
ncbi:hypothetical protein ACGWYO_002507 [Enterococcus hirae]